MTVAPRRKLGQHFLSDRGILARIVDLSAVAAGDAVVEIGPGPGGLTAALLERGAYVVAIERDARFSDALRRRFAAERFTLVEGDALKLDWPALVRPVLGDAAHWHVVGNIPYNITSPLIDRALSPPWPGSVTFLVQREFADRAGAPPGSRTYGALSVGVQAIAEVSRGFTVARGAFQPPPAVDSAVLRLVPRTDPAIAPGDVADFRRLVTGIFSYRRKRIDNALKAATGRTPDHIGAWLARAHIDPGLRPESIAVAAFVALYRQQGDR